MWGALFPGQGSQSVGMGRFLVDEFRLARELFEQASDTLHLDFKKLCFDGPESDLQLTENTQPALLLVSVSTDRVLRSIAPYSPRVGAGHSVGEYAALVSSGVLSFSDALRAVRRRGQEMQRAVPVGKGAMCAVLGLSDDDVVKLCRRVTEESGAAVEPANFNCPGQVVVSGEASGIQWMRTQAKAEWAAERLGPEAGKPKYIPLAVSAPFHCSLMAPAEEAMADVLGAIEFHEPQFAIIQNLTATSELDPKVIRKHLTGQISGAVRWSQCQMEMLNRGVTRYVELGNGKVLSGLLKKIATDHQGQPIECFNINSLDDLRVLETRLKGE